MQETNPIQAVPEIQPDKTPNIQQPKTNNFLIVLLSILLVISVSISGFFAYQTQKLVRELTEIKIQAENLKPTEPVIKDAKDEVLKTDTTESWKNYTNTNLKISFKYPSDWNIRGFAGDQENFQAIETTYSRFILESADNKVSISFQKPFFEGGFDPCYSRIGSPETTKVGNEQFSKHTYECATTNSRVIYLVSEAHNYSIVIMHDTQDKSNLTIDQFLSTFKFTN